MNPFPLHALLILPAEEMLVYCQGQQAGPLVPDHGRGGVEKWVVISLDGTSSQEEGERCMLYNEHCQPLQSTAVLAGRDDYSHDCSPRDDRQYNHPLELGIMLHFFPSIGTLHMQHI